MNHIIKTIDNIKIYDLIYDLWYDMSWNILYNAPVTGNSDDNITDLFTVLGHNGILHPCLFIGWGNQRIEAEGSGCQTDVKQWVGQTPRNPPWIPWDTGKSAFLCSNIFFPLIVNQWEEVSGFSVVDPSVSIDILPHACLGPVILNPKVKPNLLKIVKWNSVNWQRTRSRWLPNLNLKGVLEDNARSCVLLWWQVILPCQVHSHPPPPRPPCVFYHKTVFISARWSNIRVVLLTACHMFESINTSFCQALWVGGMGGGRITCMCHKTGQRSIAGDHCPMWPHLWSVDMKCFNEGLPYVVCLRYSSTRCHGLSGSAVRTNSFLGI